MKFIHSTTSLDFLSSKTHHFHISVSEIRVYLTDHLWVLSEHPGLIFRMDWLDLLAVQGTLKSLLQYHSSKASILQHSTFFTVQLSHPYMTTGKIIALTRRTSVGKVMSLLFNMLSAAAAKSLQSCSTLCDPRRQPTRLLRPWDFPGKSTGVGCHCLLRFRKIGMCD